jgi:hypothetical protein
MKNTILTLLIAITVLNANSQDVITKKDGTDINVKVKEITIDAVKYLNFDNQNGPLYTISKTDIFRIKYENGNIESFAKTITSQKPTTFTELENKVDLIIYNNDRHHKAYQNGKIVMIVGGLIAGVGAISGASVLLIVGAVGQVAGAIIEWDSHKWFARNRNPLPPLPIINYREDDFEKGSFVRLVTVGNRVSKGVITSVNDKGVWVKDYRYGSADFYSFRKLLVVRILSQEEIKLLYDD